MELQDLRYDVADHVATITLDRPDARNAYSEAMVRSLREAFRAAEDDPEVRVVLLTGEGSAFSAGGDLQLMREHSGMFEGSPAELRQRYLDGIHEVPQTILRFRKPIVAAINGPAIGAGLDLACMCDIRVASSRARFGSTFIQLGLVPGDGGAYFLARIIGFPRALELILTGRVFDAIEADRIGLVHEIVEPSFVLSRAKEYAKMIAAHSPEATKLARSLVYESWHLNATQSLNLAASYQGIAQNRPEHDALVDAMIARTQKRD